MSSLRNFRSLVFIGAGLAAAGAVFYFAHSGINSQNTQGAIGQREVYRDGQVNASDVKANPGSAPVAMKALLESKDFKALQKNAGFEELLANSSFQTLARDSHFVNLMQNPAFLSLSQNVHFVNMMQQPAMAELAQYMGQNASQSLTSNEVMQRMNSALASAHAQELTRNEAFQSLIRLDAFQSLMRNSHVQELSNLLKLDSFANLMRNSNFQGLMMQSSFQNALLAGSAANLSSQMQVRQ